MIVEKKTRNSKSNGIVYENLTNLLDMIVYNLHIIIKTNLLNIIVCKNLTPIKKISQ